MLGKAIDAGTIELAVHDLRDWTTDRHRTVDDAPYGGGPGMVMKPDVWGRALDEIAGPPARRRWCVPDAGRPAFTQQVAAELAAADAPGLRLRPVRGHRPAGRRRRSRRMPVRELSIGDYVLAGGEVAVLVMIEAIARLLPGVLGNPDSAVDDSFGAGRPGCSSTRLHPAAVYRELPVPAVLLSGNHAAIARWRRDESLRRTAANRPDLVAALDPASWTPARPGGAGRGRIRRPDCTA